MARWQVDSSLLLNTPFPATTLTLPPGLDIYSTLATPSFRVWSQKPPTEDIILLAEFSEIEGPMPLLTIPHSPSHCLDLNDFVVKILSTDYLNTSGEFRVYEDTQLVQQDLSPGVHVYVHYFTLYDVRARGFVRPMCLSYISADYRKLLRYFSQLRQHFIVATEFLKFSNYGWFNKEMVGLIRNLEYTKDRYILTQRTAPSPTLERPGASDAEAELEKEEDEITMATEEEQEMAITYDSTSATIEVMAAHPQDDQAKMLLHPSLTTDKCEWGGEEDEGALLRHTSLESVATQLLECQHILQIITPHMNKKEIDDDLECLREQIVSKPQCPLYKTMKDLSMFDKPEENAKPTICILSMMKRNFHNMRTIQQLCGVGYVACLFKLKFIFDKYCKSFSTLMFEDFDSDLYENPFSSLFIGNIPIVRITRDQNYKPPVPSSSYPALCWDTHFVKFLRNGLSNVSTPDKEFCQAIDVPHNKSNVSAAADCLKVFSRGENDDSDDRYVDAEETENTGDDELSFGVPEVQVTGSQHGSKDDPILREDGNHANHPRSLNATHQNTKKESKELEGRVHGVEGGGGSSTGSPGNTLDLSSYEDIQEEEGVGEEVLAVVGPDAAPRLDVVERMVLSKVCRLSGLVHQFCGVSHCLLHALLSGRPVVLAAAETYRPMVALYVRALATLLPRTPATHLPILRWHTGTVTEHHLQRYRVMGVCIPERLHVQDLMSNSTLNQVTVLNIETGHISGVAYSGTLVRGVEQYGRKMFHSNSALQACLQSILVSLGLKVYLLYHLLQTTDRLPGDILKAIKVTKGDWDIVTYLAGMVQQQLKSREV